MKKVSIISLVLMLCTVFSFEAMADAPSFYDTIQDLGAEFCWFCPIFGSLFDAMNTIATTITTEMADTFIALMGVALLFSIGFKVAKMLTSLQAVDLMQFLTDMFRHLGRAIIAFCLLYFSLSIFTYLVSPVLTMSLSLSTTILETGGFVAIETKATQEGGIQVSNVCDDADANAQPLLEQEAEALNRGEQPQQAFAPSVKAALICMFRTIAASLITGMAIGAMLWVCGWFDLTWGFIPNFLAILAGGAILFGHLLIFIAAPFKFIDGMIRMAFVCALMPLWIILWVFPATVAYTKKAWDMFLSTCAIFMCMSVVLILVIHLINAALPREVVDDVVEYLVDGEFLKALEVLKLDGKKLLVTLIMCGTGYKMLGTATTLASSFIGSIPNLGVGDQMAKTSASLAHQAKGAGAAGAMMLGNVGKNTLNAIKPGLGDKVASGVKNAAPRVGAAVLTMGYSEAVRMGAKLGGAAGKNLLSLGKSAVNSYKNRYANAQSPTMGASGTNMGVDTAAMGFVGDQTRSVTENNRSVTRTDKNYRDAEGNKLRQTYDDKGNLVGESLTRKDGSTMTKIYGKDGKVQLESATNKNDSVAWQKTYDKNGTATLYQNDENGKRVSVTRQKLDDKGRVQSEVITDVAGNKTTRTFDEKGHVRSEQIKGVDGQTISKTYNEKEQLTNEVRRDKDGQGHNATHRYDADGKFYGTDFKFTNGDEQAVLYNDKGQVTGVTHMKKDGSGWEAEYQNGEVVKTVNYDKEGRVETTTIRDEKETHRESVEREVVHEKENSGTDTASRTTVETSVSSASSHAAETPASSSSASSSSSSSAGSSAGKASEAKKDDSKLESQIKEAKSLAESAKQEAENAKLAAQLAASQAHQKTKDEKDKNK
ncbi:MAG: RHS repeat protein [Alphaproteobacteria bacterium]|nr:RHS repeat protein [Alphaproteobacteria bacterium]